MTARQRGPGIRSTVVGRGRQAGEGDIRAPQIDRAVRRRVVGRQMDQKSGGGVPSGAVGKIERRTGLMAAGPGIDMIVPGQGGRDGAKAGHQQGDA